MSNTPLAPTDTVAEAAEYAANSPVGRTIIEETLNEGIETGELTESGRTWCSGDEKGTYRDPLQRLPAAIDLSGCPPGDLVVTWHTHTTEQQLRKGAADRDEMAAQFQNALGVEAEQPSDVTDAIENGTIFNAPSLRDRTFEVFDGLTQRIATDRGDLQPIADDLFDPDTQSMTAEPCDGLHTIECDPNKPGGDRVRPDETADPHTQAQPTATELRATGVMRRESRIATAGIAAALNEYEIKSTVVGTAVGMFTSRLLERAIFGD